MSEASRTSRRAWPERSRGDPAPAAISNRHGEEFSPQSSYPRSSVVQRGTNLRRRTALAEAQHTSPTLSSRAKREARVPGTRDFRVLGWEGANVTERESRDPAFSSPPRPPPGILPRELNAAFGHTTAAFKGRASEVAEKLDVGWKWAGHDLGRAAKSPKMSGALAPEGRLSELNEFFSSLFSVPCPHHSFSQPGTNRRRRTTLPEAPHPTTRAAVGKSNLKNALSS